MDYSIFKAYDIRGTYPDQLNENYAKLIGSAFAQFAKSKKIIIGRDMRSSSEEIFKGLGDGIKNTGADIINIGLVSTDTVYYASGKLNYPAVMITASHNPKEYNGMKFCLAGASPVGKNTGLEKIKELTKQSRSLQHQTTGSLLLPGRDRNDRKFNAPHNDRIGKTYKKDILNDYKKFVLKFVKKKNIKPLKIAIDAGNGMAGKIIPIIFKNLPVKIIPLYFKLDGNFPNHPANPIEKKNLKNLIKTVKEKKADLGMAFDGDADRVFFIDENGKTVLAPIIVAIIAKNILQKNHGAKIIYDLRCSRIVPETIKNNGGKAIIERVGHSFIKDRMKKTGAIFAGELSGHYYYRDNFRADSGIITALIILEILSKSNKKMSALVKELEKYYQIEEKNFKVKNKNKKIKEIKKIYGDGKQSQLDGLSVEYSDWWFNIRPSNTEPVLRLNLEANTKKIMLEKRKELSRILKK